MSTQSPLIIATRRHGFITVTGSTSPYCLRSDAALVDVDGADRWLVRVGYVAGTYQSETECPTREAALELLAAMPSPPVEPHGALLDTVEVEPAHLPRRPTVVARYDSVRGWRDGPTHTTCARCKSGIRRVVVVEDRYGRQVHVGTDCAETMLRAKSAP